MLSAFMVRVKEGIMDKWVFFPLVFGLAFMGLAGSLRLWILSQPSSSSEITIEREAFTIQFLGMEDAGFAALSGGSVYYPISCKKLPKRDESAYMYFHTSVEAEGFGLRSAKGC